MADQAASAERIFAILNNTGSLDDTIKAYDKWAQDGCYDKDVNAANKKGSVFLTDEMEELYPEKRAEVRILDVAAGTGRAALELRRRGYTNLDALEPSAKMLDVAKERQLYNNYICAAVAEDQLDIPENTYDAVVSVGGISAGHLPAVAVVELLRIAKKGSVVILVGSQTEWDRLPEYSIKMTQLIKDLEQQSKLCIHKWTTRPQYMFAGTPHCMDGIVVILRKL